MIGKGNRKWEAREKSPMVEDVGIEQRRKEDIPIFTTFENWTDFSAACCKSSIEKILRPESLIYVSHEPYQHLLPFKAYVTILEIPRPHHLATSKKSISSREKENRKLTSLCAISIFVPCNLATIGVLRFILSTTLINPWAIASHRTIPPKIFTKMAVTLGSDVMRSKACLIACGVAPPPTSRKFAGAPPLSFMISIVAIARPAPLTAEETSA